MQQDPRSFAKDRVSPAPASLDWPRLVATLAAYQASTRTAQVAMRLDGVDRPVPAAADTLADLIEGDRAWTGAAAAMAGRFHADLSAGTADDGGPQT